MSIASDEIVLETVAANGKLRRWTRNELDRLPIVYEDDLEFDLGEANPHVISDEILHVCLLAHFAGNSDYQVFSNLNVYYPIPDSTKPMPYVSPDSLVVKPDRRLPEDIRSYEIGRDGPAPEFVGEILSQRSAQQRDLDEKPILYAMLGVREYLLVDVSGEYLPQRLLLKRLRADGSWEDLQDADGGITSLLGFRVIIDTDYRLRVIDAATGHRYARPFEAEIEAHARREAEEARREAEEARQQAEEARQRAEEAQRLAAGNQRIAEATREEALRQKQLADEARRQAELQVSELEAEIARLKKLLPPDKQA